MTAGALPIEFPTISLGEVFLNPTSLKFRNLMSMDTEEMIRAQPMDSVVLMGGCDKTVPAQLMGAVSPVGLQSCWSAGPMMTGRHRGERLGACTDAAASGRNTGPARLTRGNFRSRGRACDDCRHMRRNGHRFDNGLHR